ncbi:energy transducer TonB [Sphingomonas aracearum]|uniref:energy transducer TonB n=1 Tax=Sphingomonas aracearum TaxID=2283317 RepID=UPI003B82C90B
MLLILALAQAVAAPSAASDGADVAFGFDRSGKVTHCTVTKSSGDAELDARTCDMVRCQPFKQRRPAKDFAACVASEKVKRSRPR